MKKKLTAVALVVCMLAVMLVGASLAYFTDTKTATNTFTVGNVSIKLIEQERKYTTNNDGETKTTLGDFTQNQKLYPIVGSAQGDKDEFGQPIAKFYQDKIVTIQNTGSEAAYIRAYFAIPSALDDGYETFNAGMNVLHFNFGTYKDADNKWQTTQGVHWTWKQKNGKWNYFETTMNGISYNVYFADYYTTVAGGATTEEFVQGVYLDTTFNYDGSDYFVEQKGEKKIVAVDKGFSWNKVECPVFAVAVQAEGFDSVDAAVTAAFGAQYNPWGGTVTNWQ